MPTTSTDKSLSENYAFTTRWTRVEKSIHFWSVSKYVPILAIPLTFMEMDTTSRNAGTFEGLRTAPKGYVRHSFKCLDVNSECRHIQVKSVERSSKILLPSQNQNCVLTDFLTNISVKSKCHLRCRLLFC